MVKLMDSKEFEEWVRFFTQNTNWSNTEIMELISEISEIKIRSLKASIGDDEYKKLCDKGDIQKHQTYGDATLYLTKDCPES